MKCKLIRKEVKLFLFVGDLILYIGDSINCIRKLDLIVWVKLFGYKVNLCFYLK